MPELPSYFDNEEKFFIYQNFPNFAKNYYNNCSTDTECCNDISSSYSPCPCQDPGPCPDPGPGPDPGPDPCQNTDVNKNTCRNNNLVGHYMSVNRCKKN